MSNKSIWVIPPEYRKFGEALDSTGIQYTHCSAEQWIGGVSQREYKFRTVSETNKVHYAAFGFYFNRNSKRKYSAPK